MRKLFALLIFILPTTTAGFGQSVAADVDQRVVTFSFVAGDDMFYIPWTGNGAELERLHALVDEYRAEIAAGRMPVYVEDRKSVV